MATRITRFRWHELQDGRWLADYINERSGWYAIDLNREALEHQAQEMANKLACTVAVDLHREGRIVAALYFYHL